MASANFTRALQLAGSLPELARYIQAAGGDVSRIDLEAPRAAQDLQDIFSGSDRAARKILRDLQHDTARIPTRSPLVLEESDGSAATDADGSDVQDAAVRAPASAPRAPRRASARPAPADRSAPGTPSEGSGAEDGGSVGSHGSAGAPRTDAGPVSPARTLGAATSAAASTFQVLEVQPDTLRTAHELSDVRRAEVAARIRERYLSGEVVTESALRADAIALPDRWALVRDFALLRPLPPAVATKLLDGVPEVRGLPRPADWHPVLDRAASSSAEEKLKTMIRDTQVFMRRMVRLLAASDALAESPRERVLIDTAVETVVSFTAAQQDAVAEFFLDRARAAPPMSTASYFSKVRALARKKAPPTIGSTMEELQDWADMQDQRLLAPPSASSAHHAAPSTAARRRARSRRSVRGPGNVVMPSSSAAAGSGRAPAATAPAPAPAHASSGRRGRGGGPSRSGPRPSGAARN